MTSNRKFNDYSSVLSEGFTDRDATAPGSWRVRRTGPDEVRAVKIGFDGKTVEGVVEMDEQLKLYRTFKRRQQSV